MLTFAARPWELFSATINRTVDAAAQAADRARVPRSYLGGSRLGDECLRKLAYEFHKVPKDEGRGWDGRLLRIFERGHDGETRVVNQLRRAGWDILRGDPNDPRTSFTTAQGRLGGHADGLVLGGPPIEPLSYPCLLEIKVLNAANWGSLDRMGLRESHPLYFAQVQTYLAYLRQSTCWFVAENANTCELHNEVIRVDMRFAQEMSDRGVRVISTAAPEEMPRSYRSRTVSQCRECFFQDRCWSSPAPDVVVRGSAQKTGIPDWVKRLHERGEGKH